MREPRDRDRYPGYDVLSKEPGISWNDQTRRVVTQRMAVDPEPHYFTAAEFQTVKAIAARIVPQPSDRPPVPVAALVDSKLHSGASDGYRLANTPGDGETWRIAVAAIDAEAATAYGARFHELDPSLQDHLLGRMQKGDLHDSKWQGLHPAHLFTSRVGRDVVMAYYAHPTAWSEVGWGGPASPRGYVRMDFDERDPWEAAEAASAKDEATARKRNRRVR